MNFFLSFLSFFSFCAIHGTLPDSLCLEIEEKRKSIQKMRISTPLEGNLHTTWRKEDEKGVVEKVEGTLGVSVFRVYKASDTQKVFVILGDRFGMNKWKVTIGGQIDQSDQTIEEAYLRELGEEYFNQLPRQTFKILPKPDALEITGGIERKQDGSLFLHGWGPCFGWCECEYGYAYADLEEAIKKMNANADRHFKVAEFLHGYGMCSISERKEKASALMKMFSEDVRHEEGFVPLHAEASAFLKEVANDGATSIPSPFKSGFELAKEYVHIYTEYRAFMLMTLPDFFKWERLAQDKETLQERGLFKQFEADQRFYQTMRSVFSSESFC